MNTILLIRILLCATAGSTLLHAANIHVLVWDERQDKQAQAYENWLGNEVIARLQAITHDLDFRSVALDDHEHGLSENNLQWADVVIWWGHVRNDEHPWDKAKRVADLVRSGDLNIGQGKVFYFRPGHETFPVFKQDEVIQVLANACQWLGGSNRHTLTNPKP